MTEGTVSYLSDDDMELLALWKVISLLKRSDSLWEVEPGTCFKFRKEEYCPTAEIIGHTDLEKVPTARHLSSSNGSEISFPYMPWTFAGAESTGITVIVKPKVADEVLYKLPLLRLNPSLQETLQSAWRAWQRVGGERATRKELPMFIPTTLNRSKNLQKSRTTGFREVTIGALILIAYGGFHLTAWHWHFPSKAEMWLWRFSALFLAGMTPVFVIVVLPMVFGWFLNTDSSWSGRALWAVFAILYFCALLEYVFARIFLVVESFISLRSVPIGVYASMPWSNYIPHI